ncbi:SMP-30/gluconolactonase/LRE family protein [Actinokineospora sp.]|uniref:SMP-30/gluconolactonase/LRE family protein n=1 Tax=Actinokineospora sp. TaxID=1872133 RepID=UPI0040384E5E
MLHRRTFLAAAVTLPVVAAATPAAATGTMFPPGFPLPAGFQPEGIAIGPGPVAYVGSLRDGSIYRAELRTGRGRVVSQGSGTPAVGLKTDRHGTLFAAGGAAGNARVIDTRTGEVLATHQFASAPTFVNDVVLTPDVAWFTDSLNPVLYGLPRGRADVITLPITGDLVQQPGFNLNGIARTPDGRALLVVQSPTGKLFRVDPRTGLSRAVDLGGETVPNGDGLLVDGRTLIVVQNRLNLVAEFRLDRAGTGGRLVGRRTDPRFDVPSTVAAFGNRLYLPNARLGTPTTPTTTYDVVAIRR